MISDLRQASRATTIGRYAALLVVCGLVAGCGRSGPDVQLVRGLVTLDQEPLADATVIFAPTENDGLAAVGRTDAEGRFRVSARTGKRYGRGTVAGEYRVVVSKLEIIDEPELPPNQRPERSTEPEELLPKMYTSETTTPFRATVAKGTNDFQFDLKSGAE